MTVHLIKMAVGVTDLDHLRDFQQGRRFDAGGRPAVTGFTRRKPRRPDEVLDGGSIYWVIKGSVRCRQRILDLEDAVDGDGKPFCRLVLDPELVPVLPTARKPFQGWRYLEPAAAPADLGGAEPAPGELPPHLLAELRALGLV